MYEYNDLLQMVENRISSTGHRTAPEGLFEPVDHIMAGKGKRIRPVLLLMACDMFGGSVEQALDPALAVEIFHNSTLVHDDIMDNALIRRSKPTVHSAFGTNTAINAGDVMIINSFKYFLDVPAEQLSPLVRVFNRAATVIMEGQCRDMDFEERADITEEEYLLMIEQKTAVLLAASLQMGALLGNASAEDQQKIFAFGRNLGIAFQVKDDWLDAFGDPKKVGKKTGGDIARNKKTLLQITAKRDASPSQLAEMERLMSQPDEDVRIAGMLDIFGQLDIRKKILDRIIGFYDDAIHNLNSVRLDDARKQPLLQMAEEVNAREY